MNLVGRVDSARPVAIFRTIRARRGAAASPRSASFRTTFVTFVSRPATVADACRPCGMCCCMCMCMCMADHAVATAATEHGT